jgi:hypothetical protein
MIHRSPVFMGDSRRIASLLGPTMIVMINVMRARHPTWFREDLERLFDLLATHPSGRASPDGSPSTRSPMHIAVSRQAVSRASSSCARTSRRDATACRFSASWAPSSRPRPPADSPYSPFVTLESTRVEFLRHRSPGPVRARSQSTSREVEWTGGPRGPASRPRPAECKNVSPDRTMALSRSPAHPRGFVRFARPPLRGGGTCTRPNLRPVRSRLA